MSASIENAAKIWTETELEALPEDGYIHEVVSGELVMSPKNNWEHGEICARLLTAMKTFADAHRLGAVWDSSTGFWMANRNCRAPDVSFVRKERLLELKRLPPGFFKGAPDLAVEILAPSLTRRDLDERLKDFFSSGTQLAWLIDPSAQRVEICRSLIQRRLLGPDGVLDGEQVLPGFQYRVVDLFKEWEW
ncbi:MAG: Uma2 family endonuclease [Verrucomicrobia bacterium]|nr:MAG: Uma2 family endonuclease [Verrucomicrobiota bacterium]